MSGEPPAKKGERTWVERGLGLFAEVRATEGGRVLLMTASIFLMLVAYYLLKVAREPLILTGGAFGMSGATLKAAAACGQAILLLGVVPAYSALAARVPRIRLINIVTLIFAGCLVAFFLAGQVFAIGPAFFVFVGIFNVTAIAQFWSFANDLYTPDEGKRLFAIIAFGQTAGAIVGADLARRLVGSLGVYPLFLIGGIFLLAATALVNLVNARSPEQSARADGEAAKEKKGTDHAGGFSLVWRSRYLLGLGFMVLLLNTVNSNGEFILGETVVEHARAEVAKHPTTQPATTQATTAPTSAPAKDSAADKEEKKIIGEFYGGYFSAVNLLSALLQLILVSRILKWAGVGRSLLIMPTISLAGYGLISVLPLLACMEAVKVAENGVDYSLQNTTQQALYLTTSRAEKYRAKQAIDTFFVRFGDVLALGVIAVVTDLLGLGVRAMAVVNVGFVIAWWTLARITGKQRDQQAKAS